MTELVDLLVVTGLGGALALLGQRLKFPIAVAQVVLGIVLGGTVLGWVAHGPLLHGSGEFGVVLLLGAAGLDTRFARLAAAGISGIAVATLGIALSVACAYAIGYWYGSPSDELIYLSLALAATSIGITVQALEQLGRIGSAAADVIITAAVIDDVIVLYLLGAAHGLLSDGFRGSEVLHFAVLAIVVLGGLFVFFRTITRWASSRNLITGRLGRGTWILFAIILGASLTHVLELSSVAGAFFAGLGTGEGLPDDARSLGAKTLHPLVLVFMPFFFVMIGVKAQLGGVDDPILRWLVVALVLGAIGAKAFSGLLGAISIRSWRERMLVGLGMVARGEVALVVATVGFGQGHMTRSIYDALVVTIISVALIGPTLMVLFAKHLAPRGFEHD